MKRIGIYGGSFNPVHHGHLITALFVWEQRRLDEILFIPNALSPLKTHLQPASPEDRLAMCRLATINFPMFKVCDIEIRRSEISYTIDTLRELKAANEAELELIIGWDNLLVFDQWKDPDEIFKIATVVVLKRLTNLLGTPETRFSLNSSYVDSPVIEISASDIRKRVGEGKPVQHLVPDAVAHYIAEHHLYVFDNTV